MLLARNAIDNNCFLLVRCANFIGASNGSKRFKQKQLLSLRIRRRLQLDRREQPERGF